MQQSSRAILSGVLAIEIELLTSYQLPLVANLAWQRSLQSRQGSNSSTSLARQLLKEPLLIEAVQVRAMQICSISLKL